ncbi:MAG TPA: glycine cleavage system protein R [Gammaproteobacteria bacterium]|nr:glycine cleavage system protein R [Gammaproteobacteria bacterium]
MSALRARLKQLLVVSALGEDRPGILHDFARAVRDCGCNVAESRMTVLGGEFAMLLLVSGNWNNITKLEGALPKLEQNLGLTISARRTSEREPRHNLLPYAIDVVCLDQPGIVYNLANFFAQRKIGIADVATRSYPAAHTGAPMFAVQMAVNIPADLHIGALREEFMDFCEDLNLDAIMEPIKA